MGRVIGRVLEKVYRPPAGEQAVLWCYLMIEPQKGRRFMIRLHKSRVNRITTRDTVAFTKPWLKNTRVRDIKVLRDKEA
ncbi:MAG TPA: hypothetical protein P5279_07925 [Anaerohalosphaeraceae bacterium]|jgi:hypothetical protein|nr:hypothetical protein [Anaerohalosphaeraceae bacterium]HRT50404.1 hypothetical protein [Anaerohalosphaeraceae bacterium]HRT86334.1 hypothetical protein [Anaerohalosphaeraceae bacterium]